MLAAILVTAHRRENLGAPLARICAALRMLVAEHPDVSIVYPVHPNPLVTEPVRAALGATPRIRLLPPVSYDELLTYMEEAYLVLTDSGGLQEEARAAAPAAAPRPYGGQARAG